MADRLWRIVLRTAPESLDPLLGRLFLDGFHGSEQLPAPDGRIAVRLYGPDRAAVEAAGRAAAGVPGCEAELPERVEVEDWAEGWRRHFRPVPVGRRLVVLPPWEPADAFPDRLPVVVEPGHAFGTGTHATTRLVLAALESVLPDLPPHGTVVDLGTGSAILAIAAARLGLPRILALDNDPEAVDEARGNATANGVADRIDLRVGDEGDVPDDCRLLLANLSAPVHRVIAPLLAPRLVPGGVAVLSGLLVDEADGVRAAWPGGFGVAASHDEGWSALVLRAP